MESYCRVCCGFGVWEDFSGIWWVLGYRIVGFMFLVYVESGVFGFLFFGSVVFCWFLGRLGFFCVW